MGAVGKALAVVLGLAALVLFSLESSGAAEAGEARLVRTGPGRATNT